MLSLFFFLFCIINTMSTTHETLYVTEGFFHGMTEGNFFKKEILI